MSPPEPKEPPPASRRDGTRRPTLAMLRTRRKKAPPSSRWTLLTVWLAIVLLLGGFLVYLGTRTHVFSLVNWHWPRGIANVSPRKLHPAGPRTSFPWKKSVVTTVFWIGEAAATHSPSQASSAWDQNWQDNNGGIDTPDARDGFAPSGHAAQFNPFYVALPFNDLAWPDQSIESVPSNWTRKSHHGYRVSGCKDRWVEIKNAAGKTCFAQWEDVGPGRTDRDDYVFGNAPAGSRASLDVSPAVAQYLGITGSATTSWRFVDESDVSQGEWLQYDEMALVYRALHQQTSKAASRSKADPTSGELVESPAPDPEKKKALPGER